jgi:hypothetical protein
VVEDFPRFSVGLVTKQRPFNISLTKEISQVSHEISCISLIILILIDSSYYNTTGRGFPDVSALSTNFQVVIQGAWGPISGTSAATPTFAAVIALINDLRILKGNILDI